jgi:hypothetical protein
MRTSWRRGMQKRGRKGTEDGGWGTEKQKERQTRETGDEKRVKPVTKETLFCMPSAFPNCTGKLDPTNIDLCLKGLRPPRDQLPSRNKYRA